MRSKQALIASWKQGLDDQPDKVRQMDGGAWYSSLMGLIMRLYHAGYMTAEEAEKELDNSV